METTDRMWVVVPRYPLLRRILWPVFGRDQLVFFAVIAAAAIAVIALVDVGIYTVVGGYVGAMLVMEITTPSSLLLPLDCEERVVQFFDAAPFLRRTENGQEWINNRGRLYRWDSDTLHLARLPNGLLVTGGYRDLQILLDELRA